MNEPLIGARVEVVLLVHAIPDLIHHRGINAGNPKPRRATRAGHEVGAWIVGPLDFAVHEEEDSVGDDGTAEAHARLEEREIRVCDYRGPTHLVAPKLLVAVERVRRAAELVGAALGDGVHVGARESALSHVERRHGDLHLLHCVKWHRLGIGLPARRRIVQAERVVEVGSVERDVVVQPVSPAERIVAVVPGIGPDEIPGAALDRRQELDLLGADERRGAGAVGIEDLVFLGRHHDARKLDGLRRHPEVQPEILPQTHKDVLQFLLCVPDQPHRHGVRPANAHVRNVVHSPRPHRCLVAGVAGYVDRHDHCLRERIPRLVRDDAAHGRRGNALGVQGTRSTYHEQPKQKRDEGCATHLCHVCSVAFEGWWDSRNRISSFGGASGFGPPKRPN